MTLSPARCPIIPDFPVLNRPEFWGQISSPKDRLKIVLCVVGVLGRVDFPGTHDIRVP